MQGQVRDLPLLKNSCGQTRHQGHLWLLADYLLALNDHH
ncbi:hypothetical protein PSFL111601_06550 [Pseudomonas floridensis]